MDRLFAVVGGGMLLAGVGMCGYLGLAIAGQLALSPAPMTALGAHFSASMGMVLVAWGTLLLAAARDESLAGSVASPTALMFALLAAQRIIEVVVLTDLRELWPAQVGEVLLFVPLAALFWRRRTRRLPDG